MVFRAVELDGQVWPPIGNLSSFPAHARSAAPLDQAEERSALAHSLIAAAR
jgi:hypothetical protein